MGNPVAFNHLNSVPRSSWAISSLVFAELQFGLEKGKLRQDSQLALTSFLRSALVAVFDRKAAYAAAGVRAGLEILGKPSGAIDQMIAGHAIALDATLVTNNTRHFENVAGLKLETWL